MTTEADETGQRAKLAWEKIFTMLTAGAPMPEGEQPSTDATPEELRNSLIVAALAFDELIEVGELDPRRVKQSMLNLLLVCDSLVPLPEGLVPATDLQEVLSALRTVM